MRKLIYRFSFFVLFCFALFDGVMVSYAEVYRWIDENGKVHFSDKPSKEHRVDRIRLKGINSYTDVTIKDLDDVIAAPAQKRVILYSASWCGVCKQAKFYFNQKGIQYREYDIENNTKGERDFKKLKGKGVPIILVGQKRMNGFSEDSFQSLYSQLK